MCALDAVDPGSMMLADACCRGPLGLLPRRRRRRPDGGAHAHARRGGGLDGVVPQQYSFSLLFELPAEARRAPADGGGRDKAAQCSTLRMSCARVEAMRAKQGRRRRLLAAAAPSLSPPRRPAASSQLRVSPPPSRT
jgi:hypothetical protein